MKKVIIYISIVCMSCAKPEQPPLSEKENAFFNKLSIANNCRVRRDIDVMLLGRFASKNKRGRYDLELILICDNLLKINRDRDSIKKSSFLLAKELYNEVLDSAELYNQIGISFTCDTNSAKYQVMSYDFPTDTLKAFPN